jgi:AAA domain-containing protein
MSIANITWLPARIRPAADIDDAHHDDASPEASSKPLTLPTHPASPHSEQLRSAVSAFAPTPPSSGGVVLSTVQPERIAWRSRGRLAAGKVHTVDGDPGLGKSTLLDDWAARISRGLALPDGDPDDPRGVILLCAEDGLADTIRPRLEAAGADLTRIYALTETPEGKPYAIPRDLSLIEEAIVQMDAALLIIDPLMAYLGDKLDAFRDQDVRQALTPLAALAERTGVAIVLVRHLNKSVGGSALYRGGGSIGVIGAARIGLLVARDPDDPDRRILAPVKSNLSRSSASLAFKLVDVPGTDVARVEYVGTSRYTADELVAPPAEPAKPTKREEAAVWLQAILRDGSVPMSQIEEQSAQAGHAWATVRRAAEQLCVTKTKVGFGDNSHWVWALPRTDADAA